MQVDEVQEPAEVVANLAKAVDNINIQEPFRDVQDGDGEPDQDRKEDQPEEHSDGGAEDGHQDQPEAQHQDQAPNQDVNIDPAKAQLFADIDQVIPNARSLAQVYSELEALKTMMQAKNLLMNTTEIGLRKAKYTRLRHDPNWIPSNIDVGIMKADEEAMKLYNERDFIEAANLRKEKYQEINNEERLLKKRARQEEIVDKRKKVRDNKQAALELGEELLPFTVKDLLDGVIVEEACGILEKHGKK